jgi:hypothetical protein
VTELKHRKTMDRMKRVSFWRAAPLIGILVFAGCSNEEQPSGGYAVRVLPGETAAGETNASPWKWAEDALRQEGAKTAPSAESREKQPGQLFVPNEVAPLPEKPAAIKPKPRGTTGPFASKDAGGPDFHVNYFPLRRLPPAESLETPRTPVIPPLQRPWLDAGAPVIEQPCGADAGTTKTERLDALSSPRPTSPADPAALMVVAQNSEIMVRKASELAERGAHFAARAECIRALRMISQALDAQTGTKMHSRGLAVGLRTLKEAEDFVPRGSRLEADLNLADVVSTHRTPVLKGANLAEASPLSALQQYYTFAQRQLAMASGNVPTGSTAYYVMGRIQAILSEQSPSTGDRVDPKAMVFYQAALLVDQGNYAAANELGVMLARYGQLESARSVLRHATTTAGEPEIWRNLAVVHQHLGEHDLAQQAAAQWRAAQGHRFASGQPGGFLRWVDPESFVRMTPPENHFPQAREAAPEPTHQPSPQPASRSAHVSPQAPLSSAPSWFGWLNNHR